MLETLKDKIQRIVECACLNYHGDLGESALFEVSELLSEMKNCAKSQDIAITSLIKNLIAELSEPDLKTFGIILDFWTMNKEIRLGEPLQKYVKNEHQSCEDMILLRWLLGQRKKLSNKEIDACTKSDPKIYFAVKSLCLVRTSKLEKKDLIKLLNEFFRKFDAVEAETVFSKNKLLEKWPKLTTNDIVFLDFQLQGVILENQEISCKILSGRTLRSIEKNPLKFPALQQIQQLQRDIHDEIIPFFISRANRSDSNIPNFRWWYNLETILNLFYQSPIHKRQVREAVPGFNINRARLNLRIKWEEKRDEERLVFLHGLQYKDRRALIDEISDASMAKALIECQKANVLKFFLRNNYFTQGIKEVILLKYFSNKEAVPRIVNQKINNDLKLEDLLYLHQRKPKTLFCFNKKIYQSSLFSEFIETLFLRSSQESDFNFKELLKILELHGKKEHFKKFLYLEIENDTKHLWQSFDESRPCKLTYQRVINQYAPELIQKCFQFEAQQALKEKGFSEKLKAVLSEKAAPSTLSLREGSYPYLIPFVRKAFKKQPVRAAAYELALRFSIRDAAYLFYLCALRHKTKDTFQPGHQFDALYHTHKLPKKSGGNRLITAPEARLKRLQRKILRKGFVDIAMHESAHGFKEGRSILTNAAVHVGQRCVVNVDIQSFFPNTSYRLILKACSQLFDGDLSHAARFVLADICSYAGGLPMGAPTSPAIANIVLKSADQSIATVCEKYGIQYTRYADDLTFSSNAHPVKIIPFIEKVLGQIGFKLDPKKTNIFRRGRRQMVTGLVVNEKPNIPRRLRKRLRAAVHKKSLGEAIHWHNKPMSEESLMGHLNWLQSVQPKEAQRYKETLKKHKI